MPEASVSGCGDYNPGLRRPVPTVYRLLCSNVRGLAGNLSDLTVASSRYDILLSSETLVSCRYESPVGVASPRICFFRLVVPGQDASGGPQGGRHTYEMNMEHFANSSLSADAAKCCFLGFVVRDRTYMCSVFTATLTEMLTNIKFDCLLT